MSIYNFFLLSEIIIILKNALFAFIHDDFCVKNPPVLILMGSAIGLAANYWPVLMLPSFEAPFDTGFDAALECS
jgi:hypothetical protein